MSTASKRLPFYALLLIFSSCAPGSMLEQQRAIFLQAEQALNQARFDEADRLSRDLVSYPLYPYLIYRKLAKQPDNGQAIAAFLDRYRDTRYAPLLRKKRLQYLASQEAWREYAATYQPTDNAELQCQYYWSLYRLGREPEAFTGAEKLWTVVSSPRSACDSLFAAWQASPRFSREQVWKRFAWVLRRGHRDLAQRLKPLLPEPDQHTAEFWLKVHDHAEWVLSCEEWRRTAPYGDIFAHGIDRLAATDPQRAETAWNLRKNFFAIDDEEQARIDRRLALSLATGRHRNAGAYLQAIAPEKTDERVRAWRVRSALSSQDWPAVLAALEALPPTEKMAPVWRYWRGRALESLGDSASARAVYQPLAKERDFYGFLAADRLEQSYHLVDQPVTVTESELSRLAGTAGFLAVREFTALDRMGEARREWMHAIKNLSRPQLLGAAKLAQRWNLDNLAIMTVARAGHRDDLALRFPLSYFQPVVYHAGQQQLDPAILYGLLRRESAFNSQAYSPAGARGLMQLLPQTGEQMARLLHDRWPSASVLFNPDANLRYGAAYFARMLDRFEHHHVLATAAYNAGPGRVSRWLPEGQAMPADIWMETIPFSETREYIAAVLEYAIVYQHRMGRPVERLSHYLSAAIPGNNKPAKPDQVMPASACE